MWNFSDLRDKEIININDGKRLGYICDIEVDMETGKIESIVVPGNKGILWLFGKTEDYVIPWSSIKTIGDDIIIVNINISKKS